MGTVTVSVAEAGRNLSKLVAGARAGNEVVITRRGQPVARLAAVEPVGDGPGQGRRAAAALARRLAARRRWATPGQVEATIAQIRDGWGE
ncbi:MAG: type II toxin-antitoxin system prevent-host-death family antitoxin [Bifidobacteriaceae bacterium]|jgi:prevent-host-death family protein|nr:type II toxin-antitoxin system prevent-host-death family antitoxin [Bifidobacteriaceae bacterium]